MATIRLTVCGGVTVALMDARITSIFNSASTPAIMRTIPHVAGVDSYEFCVIYAPML